MYYSAERGENAGGSAGAQGFSMLSCLKQARQAQVGFGGNISPSIRHKSVTGSSNERDGQITDLRDLDPNAPSMIAVFRITSIPDMENPVFDGPMMTHGLLDLFGCGFISSEAANPGSRFLGTPLGVFRPSSRTTDLAD